MPLKRAVTEFGKTYKDRFALRTYPGTSVPIFIFILGWSRTKPRVTLSAQTVYYNAYTTTPRRPQSWVLLIRRSAQPHLTDPTIYPIPVLAKSPKLNMLNRSIYRGKSGGYMNI